MAKSPVVNLTRPSRISRPVTPRSSPITTHTRPRINPVGHHGRILCTILGGGIRCIALRGGVNSAQSSNTGPAVGLGALGAGLPVAGYLIGNAADRRIVTYLIVL